MHITDLKAMEAFSSKLAAPNTSLGLSLTHAASPSPFMKEISPSHAAAGSPLLLGFNQNTHIPVGSLLNFLNPSLNPSKLPNNKLHDHNLHMHMHLHASPRPPPPVQLELLPLAPSAHKLSSPLPLPPPPHWPQPPVLPPLSPASSHFPSISMRGIDVNQTPAAYTDRDEISESSGFLTMKREREERSSDAELERTCEVSSRGSDEEGEGGGCARKKLRLSKEQSTLLEESFKEHSTLNPKQKAELARQLSLRPRQVEVWFQNRRARTKLKQTEVDCELLKRCCETLTEENRRLQKEVQELRAMKVAPPCVISHDRFMPMPAATLSICPSCEQVASHVTPSMVTGSMASQPSTPSSTLSFSLSPVPTSRQLHHPHRIPLTFPSPTPPQQHALPSAAC